MNCGILRMTNSPMPTPTDLANLARCAHRVYLDVAGDPAEKLPASAFLELLWESGRYHDNRVIAALRAVGAKVSDDKAIRIAETRRLMAEGTPLSPFFVFIETISLARSN